VIATSPRWGVIVATAGLCAVTIVGPIAQTTTRPSRKHVLAWADVRNGYQHEVISHALAVLERMGHASGAYDMDIRTDSQLITKQPITFTIGTGIATGEQFLAHDLNFFDAIFFFGVREIDLTADQRRDLLSFVRDDGKGFVAAHSAATAFFSWPEFGDLLGGRFDRDRRRRTFSRDAEISVAAHASRRALSTEGFLARQAERGGAPRCSET